ncbi:hypothetical protein [Yersinia intermedia]|uniref:hypothetical protein n=1 Tax=Yersinia intermedia TaxID=631 RepID=UPI0005ABF68A|nr:hypothetical protein [Yersinia intermedia]AJJ20213.1 hypothetical protein CH53_4180 [Yersinia intermedia]
MLDGYFDLDASTGNELKEKHKRLLVVKAALEIAKASASSASASSGGRMYSDLDNAKDYIEGLADAIQHALEKPPSENK